MIRRIKEHVEISRGPSLELFGSDLTFEWGVERNGYRFSKDRKKIVQKIQNGDLFKRTKVTFSDGLHHKFSEILEDPNKALDFVSANGPLGINGGSFTDFSDEWVQTICAISVDMAMTLRAIENWKLKTKKALNAEYARRSTIAPALNEEQKRALSSLRSGNAIIQLINPLLFKQLNSATFELRNEKSKSDKNVFKLHVAPRTLLGALWLFVLQELVGFRKTITCGWCGERKEVGRGCERDIRSDYCSHPCMQQYSRRKKIEEKKLAAAKSLKK